MPDQTKLLLLCQPKTFFLALIVLFCCGCQHQKSPSIDKATTPPASARQAGDETNVGRQSNKLRAELAELLEYYDERYDPAKKMLLMEFKSPGYHSKFETGSKVHPTRDSLSYANALLQRAAHPSTDHQSSQQDRDRAQEILRTVLALQDKNLKSETRGVWPWHLEESLQEMSTPDLNWADFCGAHLAQILFASASQLPEDLQKMMRDSLRLAADQIRKRNVQPGYTNIAVLGGIVCAVAGELLDDQELLDYGRSRLQAVVEHTRQYVGFSEYNSPPYCKVVIAECERGLQVIKDQAAREAADWIRRAGWKVISESFHPPTAQWIGPQSRSSRSRLRKSTADFVATRIGREIKPHWTRSADPPRGYGVVHPIPCPDEYLTVFSRAIEKPYALKRTFIHARTIENRRIGMSWFDSEACLGSINRSSFWTQRKPVNAFWKTEDDSAIVFRVRFLHDGRDFASMGMQSVQQDNRVLLQLHTIANRGDWHRSLDRPSDGIFAARDLRLRFQVSGQSVAASQIDRTTFQLSAGNRKVVIHLTEGDFGAGQFAGSAVRWKLGRDDSGQEPTVFLDGIAYKSVNDETTKDFDFSQAIDCRWAAGFELLKVDDTPSKFNPGCESDGQTIQSDWELPGNKRIYITHRIR